MSVTQTDLYRAWRGIRAKGAEDGRQAVEMFVDWALSELRRGQYVEDVSRVLRQLDLFACSVNEAKWTRNKGMSPARVWDAAKTVILFAEGAGLRRDDEAGYARIIHAMRNPPEAAEGEKADVISDPLADLLDNVERPFRRLMEGANLDPSGNIARILQRNVERLVESRVEPPDVTKNCGALSTSMFTVSAAPDPRRPVSTVGNIARQLPGANVCEALSLLLAWGRRHGFDRVGPYEEALVLLADRERRDEAPGAVRVLGTVGAPSAATGPAEDTIENRFLFAWLQMRGKGRAVNANQLCRVATGKNCNEDGHTGRTAKRLLQQFNEQAPTRLPILPEDVTAEIAERLSQEDGRRRRRV